MNAIKSNIYQALHTRIDERIVSIRNALESVIDARNNESKSSVGDKYETGRAMMQMEEDRLNGQLQQNINLKNQLSQLDIKKSHEHVESGSLVYTNAAVYFIGVGLGKIKMTNVEIYAISAKSPIGIALHGKKEGDVVLFQKKEMIIKKIN